MTFSIGVRTIARAEAHLAYLLARFVESGTLAHPSLVGFHISHGEGLTPNANGIRAIRLAARDEADWLLFLEDDIEILDDFLGSTARWLEDFATPRIMVYPLGCNYAPQLKQARKDNVWNYPIENTFYGSTALAFRTADALAYASWLEQRESLPDLKLSADVCFDLWLGRWHLECHPGQPFLLTPSPCFVDHLGAASSMAMKPAENFSGRYTEFAGRSWRYRG